MAIEVFNRYENKYKMDQATFEKVIEVMDCHMEADAYNVDHQCYTISNIYYDTADDQLIRRSLSKPKYKEKLRLRSYGVPEMDSKVYLEIKKKYYGLVNKRRTTLQLDEAYSLLHDGMVPPVQEYMNSQVLNEIIYFLDCYKLQPKVYIAYDRLAYFEKGNCDLRISFDTNIRTRRTQVGLEQGDFGTPLLDPDTWLMEIKTSRAMPVWLTDMLTSLKIRGTSFSKYGTEFKRTVHTPQPRIKKKKFILPDRCRQVI